MCNNLSSNICQDFGITVGGKGEEGGEICHENQLVTTELHSGDAATVKVWWANEAVWNAKCYTWCSNDGKLPNATTSKQPCKES